MRGFIAVAGVGLLVAGCSPADVESTPTDDAHVDLSRLGEIAAAFPAGYPAQGDSRVGTLDERQAEMAGDLLSFGKPLTADPDECRALLSPVAATAGAHRSSVSSIERPEGPFISVSAYDPVSVATSIPQSGCERFRFDADGALPDGTANRLAAPEFDDAMSYALRVDFDVTNPASTQEPTAEYFYNAIVGDNTYVLAWARVPAGFAAEPALPDLLTRAVAAIRS